MTAFALRDPHAVAVLSVPPCSTVVVAGVGTGAAVRGLSARMCRVWALERDADAAQAAAPWCEAVVDGTLETVDLEGALAGERCDAVLLLDGLERLADAANTLQRLVPLLAPGGRIVLVQSNANGKSASCAVDRCSQDEWLRLAGLRAIDEIRLVDPDALGEDRSSRPDPVDSAGPPARDGFPCVVIAAPAVQFDVDKMPGLAGLAMDRLQRSERRCRQLEAHVRDLEARAARHDAEQRELRAALEEVRDWHRRSSESVTTVNDALRREAAERRRVEEQLAAIADDFEQGQVERRFLRDDLAVKDAYLASLREENARQQEAGRQRDAAHELERQQWENENEVQRARQQQEFAAARQEQEERIRTLAARLDTAISEHAGQTARAEQLGAATSELRQQLASAQAELQRVHTAVAETLAQPRYVLADRVNGWVRKLRFVHRPLKRAWLGRRRPTAGA